MSTPAPAAVPAAAPAAFLAARSFVKYISIRFNQTEAPQVYVSGPGPAYDPTPIAGVPNLAGPLTLAQTAGQGAEMSVQAMPWTGQYPAPMVWYLNQAWALSNTGLLQKDVLASKTPAGDRNLNSDAEVTFQYDTVAQKLTWKQRAADGNVRIEGSTQGWYLILKLRNAADAGVLKAADGTEICRV